VAILVVAAMAALHADLWEWTTVLVVALVLLVYAIVLWFKPDPDEQTKEVALGTYLVRTKRVTVEVPEGSGASVWPQRWWAPWRPTAVHVVKIEPPTPSGHSG
jgi:hypothetical protein